MRDLIHGGRQAPIDLSIEVSFPDIVKGDRKQTLLDAEKAGKQRVVLQTATRGFVRCGFV